MTISYKWLSEYLPVEITPERMAQILTSIGLEVESMTPYEEFRGGLKGLVIAEVLTCNPHPNADKLKLTTVATGAAEPLKIVCGAPNVAAGQKVIVAPVGTTIYPLHHEPVDIKLAKIRGAESEGMICAEDEIGMGDSHNGILILPQDAKPGTSAAEFFGNYTDVIYEIGLTPNRMEAMSHRGVARDVCAYLSHHDKKDVRPKLPVTSPLKIKKGAAPLSVTVKNQLACPRYSGICIHSITIAESPKWLQQRLKAIGLRPINNIVDITNFIQHETGQPLHAFDADKIRGKEVVIKNLAEGTPFTTLDEKERKVHADDLMICDAEGPMCFGGVFGGLHSGVTSGTKNIFLESACFDAVTIRKTSFRHGLRTDAATRFEKGTDISATAEVLKRATALILDVCGGETASDIFDIYPQQNDKTQVVLKYHYLKKLSGKNYHPDTVKKILTALGFGVEKETVDALHLSVPYHKPDITLPADIVEEILRIDGLDNIAIPASITITPAVDENTEAELKKEKISSDLVGLGFYEILTNSITNKDYFNTNELATAVKMKNSLSAGLNLMRPDMLPTGLEVIAHNINRKNENLKLFEFGKTYMVNSKGGFDEPEHLCIYLTGKKHLQTWKHKAEANDIYTLKGVVAQVLKTLGVRNVSYEDSVGTQWQQAVSVKSGFQHLGTLGIVSKAVLSVFNIKQTVVYACLSWNVLMKIALKHTPSFSALPKYPAVQRDIAMVGDAALQYAAVEDVIKKLNLKKLKSMQLFDVFESEKLGVGKKSFAVNFIFIDEQKTLTDGEIEEWMNKIMQSLERNLQVEIRK